MGKIKYKIFKPKFFTSKSQKKFSKKYVKIISEKDDSIARRIILIEETWFKVEDIDTAFELWDYLKAYYCETEEEKTIPFNRKVPTEETTTITVDTIATIE
ncbi:hypothetical protein H8356DRAFT_1309745 [Neocallimastix lanati (nom. inval.)]|nr:hypothetical protein H8356DRAFT_1309745 [Neocallimastix sp. JGI-2020a]